MELNNRPRKRALWPSGQGGHRARAALSFGAGLLIGAITGAVTRSVPFAVVGGWATSAATFLAITWSSVVGRSAEETAQAATAQDDTRVEAGALLVASSLMSLCGVVFGLVEAASLTGWRELALTSLSVVVVALSWTVVHTVFMLRYAHEFYSEAGTGGIDFGDTERPDYLDFAYLAFTVGMTFQVSDPKIKSHTIRRTVLRHALLSYVFGAVIVSVTINVVAGLLSQ